jgi:hypothetical protein
MNIARIAALFSTLVLGWAAPCSAQVFWSSHSPAGITDAIWCVTYANGTFAAVTDQGNLLTSGDGLAWGSQTIDPGVWLVSIAYGNGLWVAVGDKGTILLSSDLKTWTSAKSPTPNRLNGVLNNGSVWVAVGEGGTVLTSPDARNWTVLPSGVTGYLHGISYDPSSGFVLISGENDAVLIYYPTAAAVGRLNPSRASQNLEAVLYSPTNPAGVVVVGADGTIGYNQDGPPIYDIEATEFFVGIWSLFSAPGSSATFRGLANGSGAWVAAGDQGTIFTSPDGVSWTQRFAGDSPSSLSTSTLLSATYSATLQRFVVTGTGGTILVSDPAPTVLGNVSSRGYVNAAQMLIGGFVIEGTGPRTVLIRGDGPALAAFGVPNPLPDPALTVFDSKGTVIATNTGWTTNGSPNGITAAALEVGAFALPDSSSDSALLLTLQPGTYTVQITSAKGNSGTALFEAYTE